MISQKLRGAGLQPVDSEAIHKELIGLSLVYCREQDPGFLAEQLPNHVGRLLALLPQNIELATGASVTNLRWLESFVNELGETYGLGLPENERPKATWIPSFSERLTWLIWQFAPARTADEEGSDGDEEGGDCEPQAAPERLPVPVESPAAPPARMASKPPSSKECRHSGDFTDVCWFGQRYAFTSTQAGCIKAMWRAWESGTPTLQGKTITREGDPLRTRDMRHVFRSKGRYHPAWGAMIIQSAAIKGAYRLNDPNDPVLQERAKTREGHAKRTPKRTVKRKK